MDITFSICSGIEDEYRITLSPFEISLFPDNLKPLLDGIELTDITLERMKGTNTTNLTILLKISNIIGEVFEENENVVLYFYCDDMHDIPRRNTNISPQKFRSDLFTRMFERYISMKHKIDIVNTPIIIQTEDRDIYIHLIAKNNHMSFVNTVKSIIADMSVK